MGLRFQNSSLGQPRLCWICTLAQFLPLPISASSLPFRWHSVNYFNPQLRLKKIIEEPLKADSNLACNGLHRSLILYTWNNCAHLCRFRLSTCSELHFILTQRELTEICPSGGQLLAILLFMSSPPDLYTPF